MLRFWKSAGWVFHLSLLICCNDCMLACKYRELCCCSVLLTFLIALFSVILKSLLCCLTATLHDPVWDSFAGFLFIPANCSNLCDCRNVSSVSRCLLSLDIMVPANCLFLQHLNVPSASL